MMHSLVSALAVLPFTSSSILPRADLPFPEPPKIAKAPNTFNVGTEQLRGLPPRVNDPLPPVWAARDIDVPFARLFHGNISFWRKDEHNVPDSFTDKYSPGVNDDAKQSACGIPNNAYTPSRAAIHPYWLKYAPLSRYCQQDMCISIRWHKDDEHCPDMVLKVTDICSIDPNDPSYCPTPMDIKVERPKMQVLLGQTHAAIPDLPDMRGDKLPYPLFWYFTKCFADGLPQPPYRLPANKNNWFTQPALPNSWDAINPQTILQQQNNQISYKAKGWETYGQGMYACKAKLTPEFAPPVNDWVPGEEPKWVPVAGGEGFGKPDGGASTPVNVQK